MSDAPIVLKCKCGRQASYYRDIDATIPAAVAEIRTDCCDQCDRGDFGSETWFDVAGREVSQNVPA